MCLHSAQLREHWSVESFGRVEGLLDADGLAGRMRTGPRALSGLAWSPQLRDKVKKHS